MSVGKEIIAEKLTEVFGFHVYPPQENARPEFYNCYRFNVDSEQKATEMVGRLSNHGIQAFHITEIRGPFEVSKKIVWMTGEQFSVDPNIVFEKIRLLTSQSAQKDFYESLPNNLNSTHLADEIMRSIAERYNGKGRG